MMWVGINIHLLINVFEVEDVESGKSNYKNGILEIIFKKKEQTKPKGRKINIQWYWMIRIDIKARIQNKFLTFIFYWVLNT